MKTINALCNVLDNIAKSIDKHTIKGLEKSANKVKDDVVELAPGTSEYKASIKVSPVEQNRDLFYIKIYTDMTVGPTIWGSHFGSNNAPAGTKYNLGYLLEHGTLHHAIPNAFDRGRNYKPQWASKQFLATLKDDWHPGTTAQPHFSLALEKNKKLIEKYIIEDWRK